MSERTFNQSNPVSNLTILLTIGSALSGGFSSDGRAIDFLQKEGQVENFTSNEAVLPQAYRINEESLSNEAYILTDNQSDYLILLSFARNLVDNLEETPSSIKSVVAEHYWDML